MRLSNNWESKWPLSGLAVTLLLFPTTHARDCYQTTDYNPDITRQSDLDAIASSGCTTLDRLTIWSNYTGTFNLPNITNISTVNQYQGYDPLANTEITSMTFPDLLSVEKFALRSFVNMSRLEMPKVERVGEFDLIYFTDLRDVEIPGLKWANRMSLMGNYLGYGTSPFASKT
ncbi:hypothetical protein BDV19DRAFT_385812 [Aspergillus venezuelensis]